MVAQKKKKDSASFDMPIVWTKLREKEKKIFSICSYAYVVLSLVWTWLYCNLDSSRNVHVFRQSLPAVDNSKTSSEKLRKITYCKPKIRDLKSKTNFTWNVNFLILFRRYSLIRFRQWPRNKRNITVSYSCCFFRMRILCLRDVIFGSLMRTL